MKNFLIIFYILCFINGCGYDQNNPEEAAEIYCDCMKVHNPKFKAPKPFERINRYNSARYYCDAILSEKYRLYHVYDSRYMYQTVIGDSLLTARDFALKMEEFTDKNCCEFTREPRLNKEEQSLVKPRHPLFGMFP